jgi:uncharacterized protein YdaU (DUF1376 family)
MSETPFMPLWVSDFVGDTLDLDAKEIGAYMLILMTMWGRDGYLPNDEKKLQRVARCGRDWPRVWASIRHYFREDGDRITQGRLLLELQKVAAKRIVNAQHGARGGRAKALKSKDQDLANATVSLQQPEPEPYRKKDRGKPLSSAMDGFAEFWQSVPRKVAKPKAQEAYAKALRQTDAQTILRGIVRYAESRRGEDPRYTAHPASWLNAGRWADEVETKGSFNGKADGRSKLDAALRGADITPPMDSGQGGNASQPLLAIR